MAKRKITIFYAWQSDRPSNINRYFIRYALNIAAQRINDDSSSDIEVAIDSDTEGCVGTPPVTETILKKIRNADIFSADLTFVARTDDGKQIPNPNVLIEHGYALKALTFEAMMPIMNTFFGEAKELPFDLSHVRHPIKYCAPPEIPDGDRRKLREKLSAELEVIIRAMAAKLAPKLGGSEFVPTVPLRDPAFFFNPTDPLTQFGRKDEELYFRRDRAIFIRLYPAFSEQPRVGKTGAMAAVQHLATPESAISTVKSHNKWGSICLIPHGAGITSLSQIFQSGEIWGISEAPFQVDIGFSLIKLEIGLVFALNNYRKLYQEKLHLNPPFKIEYGITGVENHSIIFYSNNRGFAAGPFVHDNFHRKYELSSFDQGEWEKTLSDFLIDLYDEVRLRRSDALTPEDVQAHNLLPLL